MITRPNREIMAALRSAAEFADSLPVFAEVTSPFLIVVATMDLPGLPPEFADLMAAHRAGLRRDLAALTAHRPNIRVEELDASHGMVFEQPEEVAAIVNGFVSRA
jgi:pimeloyl-ACP methyl ester carboxylesterase